jgi:hypothetical protein
MTSLFDRLQFNFDQTKFGSAITLSEESINTIGDAATDVELADWQLEDLANNTVVTTNYFINPVANVCDSLSSNLSNLISSISTLSVIDSYSSDLLNSSINCMVQIDRFKSHTDNVSGVAETTASDTIPCYSTAMDTGQVLLTVLNKTDNMANSLPAMGSFTSIFIEPELNANNISLGSNCNIYINSVSSNTTNLSSSQITSIKTVVDNLNNFLYTRWSHDWNFYGNSVSLLNDYFKLDNLNNIGSTQSYLIDNYIGTEKIKTDIANNNIVIPVTEPPVVVPPPSYYEYFNQF